ncbi:MAG: hypothetical protein NWS65_06210, partial [Candidatus Nanopelagicales bacterium]|nr:hypothetical protein [Candidatus Nanopelagicales bacterium]
MTARRFIGGRAEDKQSYWRRVDWWLVIPAAFLSLASSVFVWSASRADLAPADDPQYFLVRHLINVTIGVGLAFVVSRFNFRLL